MKIYLISYDIGGNRNRGAVARRLEKLGRRVQKSVFLVECAPETLEKLEWELQELLESNDSLLIAPLCRRCFEEAVYSGPKAADAVCI